MKPSQRDKRIRIGAGLVIMALRVLSTFFIFVSSYDGWFDILLGVLCGLQSLFMLAVGIYLVRGRGKARTMVQVPERWPRIGLALFAVVGTAAIVFGFVASPENLGTAALWPNLVGVWILLQFRSLDDQAGNRFDGVRTPARLPHPRRLEPWRTATIPMSSEGS